jgi:hypothetical protein
VTDRELKILEMYELKVIVTEVILTCAAAEGYCNRGETNPWPQIPWQIDKHDLMEKVWTMLQADPHYQKLKGEQRSRMRESVKLRLLTKDELKILDR